MKFNHEMIEVQPKLGEALDEMGHRGARASSLRPDPQGHGWSRETLGPGLTIME